MWNQQGETGCLITVKAFIPTYEFRPDNEDQAKKVLESPNKNQMIAELFPKNDKKQYQGTSEDNKKIVQEQGNIEPHEIFMITDATQCQTC